MGLALSWKRNLENVALLRRLWSWGAGPKVGVRVCPLGMLTYAAVCLKHRPSASQGQPSDTGQPPGSPEGLGCRAELPPSKDDRLSLLSQAGGHWEPVTWE